MTLGVSEAAATGHGPGWYGVWGNNVAVRVGWENCYNHPGPVTCDRVVARVSSADSVNVLCQEANRTTVGGNPYWVWVIAPNGERGYIPEQSCSQRTFRHFLVPLPTSDGRAEARPESSWER